MRLVRVMRYGAWAFAIVLTLVVAYLTVNYYRRDTVLPGATVVAIGGPYRLQGTNGEIITEASFPGKAKALFFGFTHCPDVCPTTLFEAGNWLKALGPDAERMQMLYITVDPERDTVEQMTAYLTAFDPRIIGLSGTREEIDPVIREFRIYARKVPLEDGDYTMDHSAAVLLFRPDGSFAGTVDYTDPPETAISKLKRLVGAQ